MLEFRGEDTDFMRTISLLMAFVLMPGLLCAQKTAPKAPAKKAAAPAVKKAPAKPAEAQAAPAPAKPEDPVGDALAGLKSADESERRQAAEKLGLLRNPKAAAPLMNALSDESPRVRQAAADSLGLMTHRAASAKLADMLLKDKDAGVRQQAAISLSYLMDPAAGPALADALGDANASVRYSAMHTLGVMKYAPAEKQVRKLLASDDANLRRGAIAALGQLQSRDSAGDIQKALGDTDRYVRVEAIKALGSIGYTEAAPELVGLLDKAQEATVRVEAALALSRMGKNDGLLTAYEFVKSNELSLRSQSLNIIAEVGDARSLQFIEELYKAEEDPAKKSMLDFTRQRLAARLKTAK